MARRAFALLGSGEFLPWSEEVDRWLLARARPGRVLILPTASAPEGRDVFERWGRMGVEHYRRQGIRADVLPLTTALDAGRQEMVAALDDAAVVFFSGGNPAFLARTLDGSPFWRALVDQMDHGLAYGGCSAGAAVLGVTAVDSTRRAASSMVGAVWRPGLAALNGVNVAPHWDTIDAFVPGATSAIVDALPDGVRLLALDERTAAVGDGRTWSVVGSGSVHLLDGGEWRHASAGQQLALAQ